MKAIEDWPGYWVSDGVIISDWDPHGSGECNPKYRHELNPTPDRGGYLKVTLCKDGKGYTRKVHRLVAEAFIPNPLGLSDVNHRDENKENNRVENLEWCTHKDNLNYGSRNEKASKALSKPVSAFKNGVWVGDYPSAKEAAMALGLFATSITQCCKGKYKQTGGFVFTYK